MKQTSPSTKSKPAEDSDIHLQIELAVKLPRGAVERRAIYSRVDGVLLAYRVRAEERHGVFR